jgi:tetratricopeptide (TPR) repeat protein
MSDLEDPGALNERGLALQEAGDIRGAEAAYRAALALAPQWSVPHYNLGLIAKYDGRWQESFDFNRCAAELAPHDQGAWWNMGIAATALGRWADARRAWAACGMPDPGGSDPPQYGLRGAAFRLDPSGAGEVVWGSRLDPARARIENIPLPPSTFRFDDIVLTDGAIEGQRVVDGVSYPVFNVLQRLVPSAMRTFVIELVAIDQAAIAALREIAADCGGAAENWGTATRILCRECSHGVPHVHEDGNGGAPAHPHCGLTAPTSHAAQAIIDRWLETCDSADLLKWYEHERTTD